MPCAKNKLIVFGSLLVLLAVNPNSTCGSTIRDDVPDSSYTALGNSPAYAAVGTFVGNGGITGCGTLIAPDWVLTAAHLVDIASSGTFTVDGISYVSDKLFTDPGWTGNVFGGNDFGLVHLSTPVTSITPAMLYTGSSEFGQVATWVGYGFTGTGLTGYQTSLGNQKRAFQNVLDGNFNNPAGLIGSDFDNPNSTANNVWGDATPLPLEGCVAPGDSGGGVFLSIDSQSYLAGVISFVASTGGSQNSVYGNLSGAGSVSSAIPWITSVVPEPSTYSLLMEAGLVALVVRRRLAIIK